MKQAFRQYGPVVMLLACILALSVGLTALLGGFSRDTERTADYTVLATTYPLYVAAQRIIGDDDTITLTRLDGAASGCLHDYQLSPSDRRAVQEADLILMNGVGAESFLDGIVDEAKCVDTSAGLDLLCSDHHHDHGGEEHHHEEEYNEHVWLSPSRYAKQVKAIGTRLSAMGEAFDALNAVDPKDIQNAEGYTSFDKVAEVIGVDNFVKMFTYINNQVAYVNEIEAIGREIKNLKTTLAGTPCILFHDSITYLAADLGLDVKLTLSVEGESGLSAHDLGQVEALAAQHPDLLLLYDTQYALRYEGVAGTPVTIRTAVQEDWLTAMSENV